MTVLPKLSVPGVLMAPGTVRLEPYEVDMAAGVGLRRQLDALHRGCGDRHGIDPEDGWRAHIEGACGELAVARFLGMYWDGSTNTFRSRPDLGPVEVRTRSRESYDLIVRKDDDPLKIYVHVTGRAPEFRVRGFIRGADARRDAWWQIHGGRPGAWFVPSGDLRTDWPT